MKIKIGIAPIAWSNDDLPELGGITPVEQCLSEAKQAGFKGIELGGKFPRNLNILKYLLDHFEIKMPGGWYGSKLRERSIDDEWFYMQEQIKLLQFVGASVFIFADISGSIQSEKEKKLSTRPKLNKDEWIEYCNKISEISNRLQDIGLPMSYHAHMGTIIQTEEDIEKFLEYSSKNTYLLYDTGHIKFAQGNLNRILVKFIERINHIHCKDIRKDILNIVLNEDLSFPESFLKGVFTVPGDGCIDYQPLLEILKKNKYNKWLVVEAEQDPKKANPFEYAKIGFNYLNNILIELNY